MSYQDPSQQPPQNPYSGPQPTDPYSGGQSGYQQQDYNQPGQPGYSQPEQQGYAQPGQPGYSQPGQPGGYQQQSYNVPPYANANAFNDPNNPNTALNMKQNTAAGLSYILFAGLIIFLVEKQIASSASMQFKASSYFLIGQSYGIIDQSINNALYYTVWA